MNFKKTLGLVLTAALVSSSLVAVKPAKAAATAVATAPTSTSALTGFNYFFAQRSLLVAGEADTYVVDTNYSGKVQYELWVKDTTDKNAKWQVVSKGADGKPGYTEAVDGQNSPYAIPLVDGFTFKQGKYFSAVYAKVAGTAGTKTYGHYIDATTGVDTGDAKSGVEQKCDIAKTGYFNAMSTDYKQKYNEMLGEFLFDQSSFVKGQKVTFKGFSSQKAGAKYKLVFRKIGADASTQVVVNPDSFQSNVVWDLKNVEAGTYQLIAWSEPINAGKSAARDGWTIDSKYVTVTDAPVAEQSTVSTKISSATLGASIVVTSDYPEAAKYQLFDATTQKPITSNSLTALGSSTTVFPAKKTGDQAIVKLFDASGKLLTSVNVTLGTDAKVDKPTPVDPAVVNITAKSSTATLGSSVVVTSDFKGATKYQLFDVTTQKAITSNSLTALGSSTTVFPAKKAGDQVIIKLSDDNGNVVATKTVTLQ